MYLFEIMCFPPNERNRVVRLEAPTLEQAMARAEALWCRQMRRPLLLATMDLEPQVPLVRFG